MPSSKLVSTFAAFASIFMTNPAQAESNTESPNYTVIKSVEGVELRKYDAYLVAEVTVKAKSLDDASSRGFRPLAGYIFGGNQSSDKIAMTAPVTTQSAASNNDGGTKIDMTAPVTTQNAGYGLYKVHFSMPKNWTMETLPTPNNADVKVLEIPEETRLAYRFKGRKTEAKMNAADRAILKFAMAENLEITSDAISAGYDSPMVPFFLRRWEVMRSVE